MNHQVGGGVSAPQMPNLDNAIAVMQRHPIFDSERQQDDLELQRLRNVALG
jgi:hypothetical protein